MNPSDDYLRAAEHRRAARRCLCGARRGAGRAAAGEISARRAAHRPSPEENPLGAWYVTTSIKGKPGGKLAGRRVALKDNVCLAGVPMMIGADLLDGYVPEVDATVVERILDAGGEIAGKAVCEYYCVSGGSHTSTSGPVHNPRKRGYTTGGSSSGSAALVAAGEVDMAIGGDQAGSIRIPASHCGIVGLKPTYGLVPYTGIAPLEITLDTCGPMTADVARQRPAAGGHRRPRRHRFAPARRRGRALHRGARRRGQGPAHRRAQGRLRPSQFGARRRRARCATPPQRFAELGATVDEVSVPAHGLGFRGVGRHPRRRRLHHAARDERRRHRPRGALRHQPDRCRHGAGAAVPTNSPTRSRSPALFSKYTLDRYGGRYYAKAQNLRRRLRAAYDAALAALRSCCCCRRCR